MTRLDAGGAQAVAVDLAEHLARQGHEVSLGYGPGGTGEDRFDPRGVTRVPFSSLVREPSPLRDLRAAAQIAAHLVRHRVDVLHTHTSKAGILGRLAAGLAGTPRVLHTAHGWSFHAGQPRLAQRLYVAAEQLAARCSTRIVGVSEATVAAGLARRIGHPRLYRRSYCGIAPEAFAAPREEQPIVGCVACLKPQKAPEEFVEVAARLAELRPELRFELVGDGELRPAVESRASALGLNGQLELAGWQTDVPRRLTRYRVLLLTSRGEGLPLVVLEALAAGTPVVATAVDGTPEAVPPQLAPYLYRPGDVEGAVSRVLRLLDDPAEAARAAELGRAHVLARHRRADHLDQLSALIEGRR